ncbi:MAG: hypothetical protein WKG01_22305 [Kofleriaceae bacterium]
MRTLVLLLVVACSKPPPADDRAARGTAALDKLRMHADQVCACPDAACRTKLVDAQQSTDQLDQTRFDAEQVEQLANDQARLTACLARP